MVEISKEKLQFHVEFVPLKLKMMVGGEKMVNPDEHRSHKSEESQLIAQHHSDEMILWNRIFDKVKRSRTKNNECLWHPEYLFEAKLGFSDCGAVTNKMIGIYLFNFFVLLCSDKNDHYQPFKGLYITQQITDHHSNSYHGVSQLAYSPFKQVKILMQIKRTVVIYGHNIQTSLNKDEHRIKRRAYQYDLN